jgi:hypothetical protein
MAKKLSGIAYGQKNLQKGANDTTILVALKRFIREEFGLDFKREWYVGFDKEYGNLCRISESVGRKELERFKWKNPDLLCVSEQFGVIIVELDGAVHDRKVQKTIERNVLFRGAGIKLIVLNIADIKEFGETIQDHLAQEMKKLLGQY